MNTAANSGLPSALRRLGRPRIWVPALIIALFLLALVVIPYAISWALKDWLLENGAGSVEIDNVDFNPFTGTVAVELLDVRVSDRETLAIPRLTLVMDWSPLFSREVRVRSVIVDGLNLLVEQDVDGALTVGGIHLPEGGSEEETAGKPWGYGIIELDIRNTAIEYRTPELALKAAIDELALSELATWVDAPAGLSFRGALNGAQVELEGELPPLSAGYGYNGRIKVEGLPLATFAGQVQPAVTGLDGRLTLDTGLDVKLLRDQPLRVKQDGTVHLEGLQFTQAENALSNERLQWQGVTELSLADSVAVKARGVISAENLGFAMPGEGVDFQQGKLAWDGSIDYTDAQADGLQVAGTLKLEKTRLDPRNGDIRLLGFGTLALESLKVQGLDLITMDNLVIKDAIFAESLGGDEAQDTGREPPPLAIASLDVDHIEVTGGKRISIDNLLSDHASYVARRNPGGEWRMATILGSLPQGDEGKAEEAGTAGQAAAEESGSLRVGVLKNTNATLTLEDYSVKPAFKMRFDALAVIKDVDTAKPDQDTRFYLKGSLARHNEIVLEGTVRPFTTPPSMNMKGTIKDLELPPLSPYAIASIGHRLESGQLDADSTLRIDQGQLDGTNQLILRGLKLSAVKGEQLNKMQGNLAVPLDKALDMLRDDNDVIRLKLPIRGNLDNPDFDISDAINQAVAKAAKEGAISSLTLLLQPYGTLITVARYAADKASQIRLDPVVFVPASAEIDPARHDYLDKVAGIMTQRPAINVKLCGVATAMDRTALQQQALAAAEGQKKQEKAGEKTPTISDAQLVDLADRRDAAVKDYLIDKHGIDAGRLVACQPMIDTEEDAEPRVDLLI